MFSSTATCSSEVSSYDFEENAHKWKDVLLAANDRLLKTLDTGLTLSQDGAEYMECLLLRVLSMLCSPPPPHNIVELEERVLRIFPSPLDRWATGDAQAAVENKRKKGGGFMLPLERIHPLLKDALQSKVDMQVTMYMGAILEYVAIEILRLTSIYVSDIKGKEVTEKDIKTAMCADQGLTDLLCHSENGEGPKNTMVEEPLLKGDTTVTYDQLVKDLIEHEKAYIRELNLISKVFRKRLLQIQSVRDYHRKKLDEIFSNIDEIYDFSVNLLGSLEDTIEVTKENESPAIGSCFEELAEGEEFDVYLRYCSDVVPMDRCQTAVQELVSHPDVWQALASHDHGENFRDAVLYYLPRLLHLPVLHVFTDLKYIEELTLCAENCGDNSNWESLEQVQGLLCPLVNQLEKIVYSNDAPTHLKRRMASDVNVRMSGPLKRQQALLKLKETQRSIEGWEGKDITQCCNSLILEGDLKLGYPSKKQSDRHVFLFDGLLVLCKQHKVGAYRFKERYFIKNIDIVDRENTDEIHHAFEVVPHLPSQASALLLARSAADKHNWMAALVMIRCRSPLERALDNILLEEEKQHPLQLPDPEVYPFSVQDSVENIIIEEREKSVTPLIKGATLIKLVERLTYHMYADPMFVRTFLTTYRSFCSPTDLLELLKKRFAIPEPECCSLVDADNPDCSSTVGGGQEDTNAMLLHREGVKRFRKEYAQPVQFRVLNVLRHWVDYHFYDFDRDAALLQNLTDFLESVEGKSMRKWVLSITKIILRKRNEEIREITFSQNRSSPPLMYHMVIDDKEWDTILPASAGGSTATGDLFKPLLMLHPIEIARQLTLLEFDLYKSVKPSELVGNAWTSKDKDERSPNLLKMIHHTNNVTHWLMRCIIDCENFEERVAAMSRVVEIMIMFYDLNNFSGLFEMSSALESAAVHRLELTKAEVKRRMPVTQKAVYEEALELGKNHCKKYLEKLRSINPPCVPFFGMYLTNIMHIEVGNPDFLLPHNLINFSKRRKVAEITGEIQQYQNQSYCLGTEPKIRRFLETLDPFEGMSDGDINNYLYNKSTEIEPKNLRKPLLKERRWPNLSLKSPGIKIRSGRSLPNPLPNVFSTHKDSGGGEGGEDTPRLTPTTPSTPCTPPPSAATTTTPTSVNAGSVGNASTLPHGASLASVALGSTDTLLHQGSTPALSHSGTLPHSFRDRERCTDQEDSVFARVEIGPLAPGVVRVGPDASVPLAPVLPPPPQTPGHLTGDAAPPPLPPRGPPRRREASLGDTSPKVQQAPDAPQLPPRDASPPPLPPRTSTLPHKHHPPSSASHLSSQATHFTYNPPVVPPSIHSTPHSSLPGPHSSVPGPLLSIPPPPSRQFHPPPYQHRTSVPPHPVPSSSAHLHHHHHSTAFHHPSHHPPPPPPPPHIPVVENTPSAATESTLKSTHIIPPARRRNPSVDMQAPPLSRRHTTNGPPLDDGPPLPPPRGPLIMRPASAFAEQQL